MGCSTIGREHFIGIVTSLLLDTALLQDSIAILPRRSACCSACLAVVTDICCGLCSTNSVTSAYYNCAYIGIVSGIERIYTKTSNTSPSHISDRAQVTKTLIDIRSTETHISREQITKASKSGPRYTTYTSNSISYRAYTLISPHHAKDCCTIYRIS